MFDADVGMRLGFPDVTNLSLGFQVLTFSKNWRLIVGCFQVCSCPDLQRIFRGSVDNAYIEGIYCQSCIKPVSMSFSEQIFQ